jgi:co-chaperonin GroES (HSP10)
MIEMMGNRVLIFPDPVEEISKGGIILNLDERKEKAACSTGTVVDFGPSAWLDPVLGGEPWCEKGDRVVFAKYSGKFVIDPEDEKEYVVINDDAIQARIVE